MCYEWIGQKQGLLRAVFDNGKIGAEGVGAPKLHLIGKRLQETRKY